MFRRTLGALAGALFVLACSANPTEPRRSLPPRGPSLAVSLAAPAEPTAVAAAVVVASFTQPNGSAADSVRVTWIDNATDADEFVTVVRFTGPAGEPVTSQSVYASAYDQPVGSTGERSGVVITPAGAAAFARFKTVRRFQREILPGVFAWQNISSAESEPVAVDPLATVTTTKGKGKR